ncbi:hypothetical protein PSV09DRAFT_2253599 [Bipolaris maydis]|nr:hypothetical protein PSV09DRAFT_2253599 [Bipolaris maydis]
MVQQQERAARAAQLATARAQKAEDRAAATAQKSRNRQNTAKRKASSIQTQKTLNTPLKILAIITFWWWSKASLFVSLIYCGIKAPPYVERRKLWIISYNTDYYKTIYTQACVQACTHCPDLHPPPRFTPTATHLHPPSFAKFLGQSNGDATTASTSEAPKLTTAAPKSRKRKLADKETSKEPTKSEPNTLEPA